MLMAGSERLIFCAPHEQLSAARPALGLSQGLEGPTAAVTERLGNQSYNDNKELRC